MKQLLNDINTILKREYPSKNPLLILDITESSNYVIGKINLLYDNNTVRLDHNILSVRICGSDIKLLKQYLEQTIRFEFLNSLLFSVGELNIKNILSK